VLAGTLTAHAQARPDPVTGWVRHHAAPVSTVDPAAPLGDLTPLRRAIGDAEIVGLGESTHGTAEEEALKHRTLRLPASTSSPWTSTPPPSAGPEVAGGPIKTRSLPDDGPGSSMAGGSLAQWFDPTRRGPRGRESWGWGSPPTARTPSCGSITGWRGRGRAGPA
jgi:hypothetical protein